MGGCVGVTKQIHGKQEEIQKEFGRASQKETRPSQTITNNENENENKKRKEKRFLHYEIQREISTINHRSFESQPFDNQLFKQYQEQGSTNSGSLFNKKILSPQQINQRYIQIPHHEGLQKKLTNQPLNESFKSPQSLVYFTNDELDLRSTFIPNKLSDSSVEVQKKYVVGLSVISEQNSNSKIQTSKASKTKFQFESSIRSKQKFGPKLPDFYELTVDYQPSGITFHD